MSGNEIREKYLKFMEKRGHAIIPSSALVPENDPTTLFTGSGMQPMVPYLTGEIHPKGTRITDSQKCFRAEDIEEVGDNRHTTFFEMLGNWSLGDYFKEEQIPWIYSFLIDTIGLDPEKFYVTAFQGDTEANVPRDVESVTLWQKLFEEKGVSSGIADIGSEKDGGEKGMHDGERIFYYDSSKNWWSRVGKPNNMPIGEIGGPDTEMFYDFGTPHDTSFGTHCHPNCDCGRFLEIGNNVFMEYIKTKDGSFQKLPKQNVDFGGGLERITAAATNNADVFKIDLLWNITKQIQGISKKTYNENQLAFRVITDHIRGAVFMIGDNVQPSNTEQGYFVRRLLRRSIRFADVIGIPEGELSTIADSVIEIYKDHYTNLSEKREHIIETIATEETQFRKTLAQGLKQFNKISLNVRMTTVTDPQTGKKNINTKEVTTDKYVSGKNAFALFTTYGFPIELTKEIAHERGMTVDMEAFKKLMGEHRQLSRVGAEHKFKGGLADNSEKVVQYHTVTHLMLAGLRKYLGDHIHQAGSNITAERLRFDFTHGEKVERDTLEKIETFVNDSIKNGAIVSTDTMLKSEAEHDPTIEGSFWERYPDEVKVYTIHTKDEAVLSRELCGGPHIQNTNEISGIFRITKEESSSAGIRRIKAVLE